MPAPSLKAQATREKILRAANDLFYLQGYNATGVDRIIAAAGITKGNFFYHFRSKEELALAVLDWHRDLAFSEIGLDRILDEASPRSALLTMLRAMADRMICEGPGCRVRGCFFGNFALELSAGSEAVRLKVRQIFDGFRDLIQGLLEKGRAAGELRPDLDPQGLAGMILGLMEGSVLLDKTSQTTRETDQAIAFLRGYLGD